MKVLVTISLILLASIDGRCQGHLTLANVEAHTRLYSPRGELAQANILGQYFLGTSADDLHPFLDPLPHNNGIVWYGNTTVAGIPGFTVVYLKLVVWDSNLWGNQLNSVQVNQLGETDIARFRLSHPGQPTGPPAFLHPAIVPIPEPSTWALGLVGLGVLLAPSFCSGHRRYSFI